MKFPTAPTVPCACKLIRPGAAPEPTGRSRRRQERPRRTSNLPRRHGAQQRSGSPQAGRSCPHLCTTGAERHPGRLRAPRDPHRWLPPLPEMDSRDRPDPARASGTGTSPEGDESDDAGACMIVQPSGSRSRDRLMRPARVRCPPGRMCHVRHRRDRSIRRRDCGRPAFEPRDSSKASHFGFSRPPIANVTLVTEQEILECAGQGDVQGDGGPDDDFDQTRCTNGDRPCPGSIPTTGPRSAG